MAKSYEELRFTDDFMFGKVMEDKELCRAVLECLLEQPVGELQDVQAERQFRYTLDGKPIRLDVYTRDQNTVYDAEMQNRNHKSREDMELPKRSRFYQSVMDTDFLQKGNSYRRLPEGKVLFICTFDPFEKNQSKNTFTKSCEEIPGLKLEDGTTCMFYNCTCITYGLSTERKAFYEYVVTGRRKEGLTSRIEEAVSQARRNEKWRAEYMKELLHEDDIREEARTEGLREGIQKGIQQGIAQGSEQGIRIFILDKLEDGAEDEVILGKLEKLYRLSLEQAERLLEEVKSNKA